MTEEKQQDVNKLPIISFVYNGLTQEVGIDTFQLLIDEKLENYNKEFSDGFINIGTRVYFKFLEKYFPEIYNNLENIIKETNESN